ncbi:MAG: (Fe-S)-binding protein [Christensenellales bacterium]
MENLMKKDAEMISNVKSLLAGFNCGACGYGDCAGLAKAIVCKKATADECLPIEEENIDKINQIVNKNE